jgi:hypothetical protein
VPKVRAEERRSVGALLTALSEAEGKEWVVRVNSRRVQWSEAVYNRMFGKENVANGTPYAIVQAGSAEEAVREFCAGEDANKGYNESYFMAEPMTPKTKRPKPFRWKGGKPLGGEAEADGGKK